jgi:hypothetical protein
MSIHGGNILRGMLAVGLLGAALGLVVGLVLNLFRRTATKVRPS